MLARGIGAVNAGQHAGQEIARAGLTRPKVRLRLINARVSRGGALFLGVLPFLVVAATYLIASGKRLAANPADKLLPSPAQSRWRNPTARARRWKIPPRPDGWPHSPR